MNNIYLHDIEMHTNGKLPIVGQVAPDFTVSDIHLGPVSLSDYQDKPVLINTFPSLDTKTCHNAVKKLEQEACRCSGINFISISMDLPFTLKRIDAGECFKSMTLLSDFRTREFSVNYSLLIEDGILAGLLSRSIIILDKNHKIVHFDLVRQIEKPPNISKAIQTLKMLC